MFVIVNYYTRLLLTEKRSTERTEKNLKRIVSQNKTIEKWVYELRPVLSDFVKFESGFEKPIHLLLNRVAIS